MANVFGTIGGAVTQAGKAVGNQVTQTYQKIEDEAEETYEGVKQAGESTGDWFTGAAEDTGGWIQGAAEDTGEFLDDAGEFILELPERIIKYNTGLLKTFIDGLKEATGFDEKWLYFGFILGGVYVGAQLIQSVRGKDE